MNQTGLKRKILARSSFIQCIDVQLVKTQRMISASTTKDPDFQACSIRSTIAKGSIEMHHSAFYWEMKWGDATELRSISKNSDTNWKLLQLRMNFLLLRFFESRTEFFFPWEIQKLVNWYVFSPVTPWFGLFQFVVIEKLSADQLELSWPGESTF